jgi:hypothetical protein
MRGLVEWLVVVLLVLGLSAVARPARAVRPSCYDLLSALTVGQSREQVARDFGTTQARIGVCTDQVKQRDRQEARREQFEARRAERGLSVE